MSRNLPPRPSVFHDPLGFSVVSTQNLFNRSRMTEAGHFYFLPPSLGFLLVEGVYLLFYFFRRVFQFVLL